MTLTPLGNTKFQKPAHSLLYIIHFWNSYNLMYFFLIFVVFINMHLSEFLKFFINSKIKKVSQLFFLFFCIFLFNWLVLCNRI